MYKPPTGPEVKFLLKKWGLTEIAAAKITNLGIQSRGSGQISRYKSGFTPMPWTVLFTLAYATGSVITQENWRKIL